MAVVITHARLLCCDDTDGETIPAAQTVDIKVIIAYVTNVTTQMTPIDPAQEALEIVMVDPVAPLLDAKLAKRILA